MWYNADGSYNGFIHTLTEGRCADMPMGHDDKYRKDGKRWYSGAKDKSQMNFWFSVMDAYELETAGYYLYEYEINEYWKDDIQVYFTQEGVISQTRIPIDTMFDISSIKYTGVLNNKTEVTEYYIKGFFEKYRPLSNFDTTKFIMDGITFKSAEHALQYYKTDCSEWKEKILNTPTPAKAKEYGHQCPMKDEWEDTKVKIVQEILYNKFSQNAHLRAFLLNTGFKYLEETNNWGDDFWGVYNGAGKNMMGKALMIVRTRLLAERLVMRRMGVANV